MLLTAGLRARSVIYSILWLSHNRDGQDRRGRKETVIRLVC